MGLISLLLTCTLIYPVPEIEISLLPRQIHKSGVLPMLIYFSSDDCTACVQFDALFEEPEMLKKMEQHYVSVRVSIDEIAGKACADIYDVRNVPAFVIADHAGIILYKSNATLSYEDIRLLLDAVPGEFPSVKTPSMPDEHESPVNASYPTSTHQSVVPGDNHDEDLSMNNSAPVTISTANQDVRETSLAASPKIQESNAQATQGAIVNSSPDNKSIVINREISKADMQSEEKKTTPKKEATQATNANKQPLYSRYKYSIQLGFFSEAPNAKTLAQKAKLKGLADTRTETESRDGKSCYRVLTGSFSTLTEAQKLLEEVHALGLKGAVHRQ